MTQGDWRPDDIQLAYRCNKTFDLPFDAKASELRTGEIPSGTIMIFNQQEPPKGWDVAKDFIVCRKV